MSKITYDVEVIVQEQNPICWIASCAMVKGFGTRSSIGVGEFTNGFDPSNSCIANLTNNWTQCTDLMTSWGFSARAVKDISLSGMTADDLLAALASGPAVLLHLCSGFPYGQQWASQTFTASDAHAVVLTGIDTDAGTATFNNPWGAGSIG
jgi:Papain-like cysteine protease AvrRpt2